MARPRFFCFSSIALLLVTLTAHAADSDGWVAALYQGRRGFIEARTLWRKANLTGRAGSAPRAVATRSSQIYRQIPARLRDQARFAHGQVQAGALLTLTARLGAWTVIASEQGDFGLLPADNLWSNATSNQAVVRTGGTVLRSKPSGQSRVLSHISAGEPVRLLPRAALESRLRTNPSARFNWPQSQPQPAAPEIKAWSSTAEVFSRPVFDLVASPITPNLRFVSAGGVFRTLDGQSWQELPQFVGQNQALAISENGHVFVGDRKSRDQGDSFESYVGWDQVLELLRPHLDANNFRLLRIEFPEGSDHVVELTLEPLNQEAKAQASELQLRGVIGPKGGYTWQVTGVRKF